MARPGRLRRFFDGAQITPGALALLFVTVGLSLVYMLGGIDVQARMLQYLAASGYSVWTKWKIWQLATSPLLEVDFISLLFQGFALWMFLPALEKWWGKKRFLLFAAYTSLVGVAAGTLVGMAIGGTGPLLVVTGLDPFVFAGIVAYGILFAQQKVQFFGVLPMTGRQLTFGIIGFVGLFIVLGQKWVEGAAMASAMITAWLLTSDRVSPRLWMLKNKQRRLRKRSHLRSVDDKGDESKKRWMN